jgi:hypothetical protein
MSSYCTAFAYRPLTQMLGREFGSLFLEIGAELYGTRPFCFSPSATRCDFDAFVACFLILNLATGLGIPSRLILGSITLTNVPPTLALIH